MIDLKKIKQELEEFGWLVSINRNQRGNGELNNPWLDAQLKIDTTDLTVAAGAIEIIKEIVPDWDFITIKLYSSVNHIIVAATYMPDVAIEPNITDYDIVPCYIRCPQVSE